MASKSAKRRARRKQLTVQQIPAPSVAVPASNHDGKHQVAGVLGFGHDGKHRSSNVALLASSHDGKHQVAELLGSSHDGKHRFSNVALPVASCDSKHEVAGLLGSSHDGKHRSTNVALSASSRDCDHQVAGLLVSSLDGKHRSSNVVVPASNRDCEHQIAGLLVSSHDGKHRPSNVALPASSRDGKHEVAGLLGSSHDGKHRSSNVALPVSSRGGEHQVAGLMGASHDGKHRSSDVALSASSRESKHEVAGLWVSSHDDKHRIRSIQNVKVDCDSVVMDAGFSGVGAADSDCTNQQYTPSALEAWKSLVFHALDDVVQPWSVGGHADGDCYVPNCPKSGTINFAGDYRCERCGHVWGDSEYDRDNKLVNAVDAHREQDSVQQMANASLLSETCQEGGASIATNSAYDESFICCDEWEFKPRYNAFHPCCCFNGHSVLMSLAIPFRDGSFLVSSSSSSPQVATTANTQFCKEWSRYILLPDERFPEDWQFYVIKSVWEGIVEMHPALENASCFPLFDEILLQGVNLIWEAAPWGFLDIVESLEELSEFLEVVDDHAWSNLLSQHEAEIIAMSSTTNFEQRRLRYFLFEAASDCSSL
eukprot:CAMPEP_0115249466 /NCGR_PEP_ID=MMETSP0270-20121206/42605_1 /TAXON_ID=71861 /ORGANISM="Scrippsiella trochoidea, Strain CCMP3099" /LENGTH=594 /DNA_ID=CAMNT_0002664809 /DNA_START=402 /DNA_END=2186 /DNA_ORIENTATION=+